jgi:colanic acid biosynthesis glycosyl transferase WcaI
VRVLVLNQYFHPDQSATSQLLTELCEDLAEHHEVFVVTGRPSYNAVADTSSRGIVSKERHGRVRVARVWSTTFDRTDMVRRLANYATYMLSSIAGALTVRKPDVVIALTDPPPIGLIGALVSRIRRVPFVLVTKDIFPEVAIEVGVLGNVAIIRILRAVRRALFSSADQVVSIGRDMDRRLSEIGVHADRVTTIHDWSDGKALRPLDGPSAFRSEQGWVDQFVVMHSGNIGLSQDLDTVVDAAVMLRDESVVFANIGDGASKSRLQQRGLDLGLTNLVFLPYQDKGDLSESLGAADVHLVMLKEGLAGYIVPSKVYGILAAGKPFIAAVEDWSEPALIVEEHLCGKRIEPGDPAALASAVLELRDLADTAEMGTQARLALERRFDRSIAAGAYLELLGGVSRKRP